MFRPDPAAQYVASKSQSVKPDVVSDIQPLDQLRLLIPSFVDFLNPKETYLRAELQMVNARGVIVPDKKGGIHSLFRNVIIRDGGNTATLENLEDYNSQCCMTSPFTAQSSLKHKRELFEGVQDDANNSGVSGNITCGFSFNAGNSSSGERPASIINPDNNDDSRLAGGTRSYCAVMEYEP